MATIERSKMIQTDSKGNVTREPRKDNASELAKFTWWQGIDPEDKALNETDLANNIQGTIAFIEKHQGSRTEQLKMGTNLYGKTSFSNLIGSAFTRASSVNTNSTSQRISFNICASVVDTLVAKIAKNKVIPSFVTNGGIWSMQRKAEKLSKFTDGVFYACDVHRKTVIAFMDACIWGTGVVKIFEDDDDICVERVYPHDILVDTIETFANAAMQKPRQMHQLKIADRGMLKVQFPEKADEIDKLMPASYQQIGGMATVADLVATSESWHLPSGKDAGDGLHAICAGDVVLFVETYEKDYFPFVFLNYAQRPAGFWGQGACERLAVIQGEVNRLMILDQKSRWMQASFKILVENGSKVVSQHLNNDVGTIIHYTGTPPQYITPPAIDASNGEKINDLIAKGYQQEGVSQLSASAMKPQGVNSGKALREVDNIEEDRFLFTQQDIELFGLEVARQCIEVAKDIYSRKKTFKVMFPSTTFCQTIDWKDVKLKADEYVLKAYPTSALPKDPAGRLETITEYMQAGLISPRAGRKLMAMPDVEMSDSLANAKEDLLHKIFEEMLDDGTYRTPEPFWDLTLAGQMVLEYINYADLHNAPEDRLSLLRRFNADLGQLTGATQPPLPPPGAAGPMTPMANPMPAPVSGMLQNTNNQAVA